MPEMEEHNISWHMPGQIGQVCFIGKDVFALHDNLNIYFCNTVDNSELIYNATTEQYGQGIECFSGHKTNDMFVFAEMTTSPRMFLVTYPGFEAMCIMKDDVVEGYLAVGLTDLEQVVALSSYPNYQISVWCWRTNKKLIACETSVRSPDFIFSWSLSQTLIFHGWDSEYCVWEIVPCYKVCTHISRKVVGNVPSIVDVTWATDGSLYCVDKFSNIYYLVNDGMGIVAVKEWSSSQSHFVNPRIIHHKEGFLVYGPDEALQYITKSNKEWVQNWEYTPDSAIIKLTAGGFGQILCVTQLGNILKINCDEANPEAVTVMFWQQNIRFVEILKPSGNIIISLNDQNIVCLWDKQGYLLAKIKLSNDISAMSCSPVSPIIAMSARSDDNRYGVWIARIEGNTLVTVCEELLTDDLLMHVVWSESGNELITCCFETGVVFFLKMGSSSIEVVQLFKIDSSIFDCFPFTIGQNLYFMVLTSIYNTKINDYAKELLCYKFSNGDEISISGGIEPTVAKVIYLDNYVITMNSLSKVVNVYSMKLEGNTIKIVLKNAVKVDHDIACISMKCEYGCAITWGLDGVILYYSSIVDSQIKYKIKAKNYLGETIKFVLFDPQKRFVLSVTHKGTLSLHNLTKTKPITDFTQKSQIPREIILEDIFEEIHFTWIERRDYRNTEEETKKWADKRIAIQKDFEKLQEKLVKLLEENILAPPLHQLPLNTFNLHVEGQQHRAKEAALEREAVRVELEEVIKSQDRVTDWVKLHCWDPMHVVERKIFAIFRSDFVENYPLPAEPNAAKDQRLIIQKFRQFESVKNEKLFTPWVNKTVDEPVVTVVESKETTTSVQQPNEENVEAEETSVLVERESFEKFIYQLTGTSSHLYITPAEFGYPQLLTQTNLQMKLQAHCIEDNIRKLKLWFNKQFDNMMDLKQKELSMIEEKDKRLNFIISELNILSQLKESDEVINMYISDPQLSQDETPQKLTTVEEDEVGVTPYISPSQVVIPPPEPVPKDDFKERALIVMMDGVLEKLWHEEIKKPIPMPECMLKENANYTEDDLKEIYKYDKAIEFRNEEREKYNKILRTEYTKLSSSVNETITRFNQKIKEFYLLKLKVESAIGQEEMKLMRLRTSHLAKIERFEDILKLERDFESNETELENSQKKLQEIAAQSAECHASYEMLMARDKALDKNFKSSFSESSSIIADLCYKYFKKRPKWQQRASMTSGVLYELAQACVTKEKPRFLHQECIDFLKALDQLDLVSNMPAAINNESAWFNMCKLRRMKIELEIKIKAVIIETAEVEMASSIWHKRVSSLKVTSQKITNDLLQIRHDIEYATKNIPLQLIMKYGYVEVQLTGHEEDFKPAVLIKLSDIDAINNKILEAGYLKLKAMRATTNFRKNILTMEWEHAKLKMNIRHLEQDIYHLERLKITKEIREYIHKKTKQDVLAGNNIAVERQVEITRKSFNNHLNLYMRHVEELEMKVGQLDNQLKSLQSMIANLKLKTSEKHQAENPDAQKKRAEACKKRMETLVFRSKLLGEVKKQYVAIVLLQTELELQRLRTYPTLTSMKIH